MSKILGICAATAMVLGTTVSAAQADPGFHPLRTARAAAELGLHTARRAVDLGLDTAEGAAHVAKNIVTFDDCRPGAHYRDRHGNLHRCR